MGLSSNILWHQTKKENLIQILKEKSFRFSYSLEYIESTQYKLKCAFPMLSLCDIPLADISDYLEKYDGYSIGFTREWGIKHKISPVIYCEQTSDILIDINNLAVSNNSEVYKYLWKLLSHIKNHEGILPKRGYTKYRFYNERETRITPSFEELKQNNISPILYEDEYENYKLHNNDSSLLPKTLYVPFEFNDIRYIIAKNEKDIQDFRKIIGNKKKLHYFTIQQVKKDIIGIDHNERFELDNKVDIEKLGKTYIFINKTIGNKNI